MKKLFFLLMLCPLLMVVSCKDNTGSASNEALLDKEIAASNKNMPMQVDNATTLLSLSRDGDVVTYEYVIDENAMDYAQFIDQKEKFRINLKNQIIALSTPDSELYGFMSLIKATGKNLRYQYKGNRSGLITTIDFPNDEIQEMIKDF